MYHSSVSRRHPLGSSRSIHGGTRGALPWFVVLVVLAGVAARLYGFHRFPGIIGDEAWYGVQAQLLLAGEGADFRTPTGNVPGAIQLFSLTILHMVLPPSELALRIPPLLTSLAAMVLAGFIARRHFGTAAGWTALVLMACLPLNIAYARLGWDPSHTPLLVLAATYGALERRRLLSTLCFAFALANHPSAVFAAPLLLLSFLGSELQDKPWRVAVLRSAAFVGMLVFSLLLSRATSPAAGNYLDVATSLARLGDLSAYASFALHFAQLLSGDTVYRFIVGTGFGSTQFLVNCIILLGLCALLVAGSISLRRTPNWQAIGVVSGWLAALSMLFVVAGSWALQPSVERFSIVMIPATVLAVAALVGQLCPANSPSVKMQLATAGLGLPLLAGVVAFYLLPLDRGLQRPGEGLRIGLPALNKKALDHILLRAPPGKSEIIAEDWWIFWPVRYQADADRFAVTSAEYWSRTKAVPDMAGGRWWITYAGSDLDRQLSGRPDVRTDYSISSTGAGHGLHVWKSRDLH